MKRFSTCSIFVLLFLVSPGISGSQTDWVKSVAPPSVFFEVLAINRDLPTKVKPKYNSTTDLAVSIDKKLLFVAQQTAKRIDVVDRATESVTGRIRLPEEVTGIAVAPEGELLYATCSSDDRPGGMVCIVDINAGRVIARIETGNGARAPVVTPDGKKLFVCNRFSNSISVIDPASRSEIKSIDVTREPFSMAVTPDGSTVLVGTYLPDGTSALPDKDQYHSPSIDSLTASAKVLVVDAVALKAKKEIHFPPGSMALAGIAVAPDGRSAFVTHTISHCTRLISTVVGGWSALNNLTIIDLQILERVNTVALSNANLGHANPWDVAVSADQKYLCVSHAGSHELSVIKYGQLMDTIELYTGQDIDLLWKFTSMNESRRIVKSTGQGPRALVMVDSILYSAGFFDDENAFIQKCIVTSDTIIGGGFRIGERIGQTAERKGEALFYDAGLCMQEWQSCHTCHPFTRASGFYRILNSSVVGTPKNTPGLLYSWWTPPTTWTGRRSGANISVRAGMQLELFMTPAETLACSIDTFLMKLTPAASPRREKGKLSRAAQRGKALFYGEKAQCTACHSSRRYSNEKLVDGIIEDPFDESSTNPPTLVETWRTAPYSHLGLYKDIGEMIQLPTHNLSAANLSATEMDDLIEYVLSL